MGLQGFPVEPFPGQEHAVRGTGLGKNEQLAPAHAEQLAADPGCGVAFAASDPAAHTPSLDSVQKNKNDKLGPPMPVIGLWFLIEANVLKSMAWSDDRHVWTNLLFFFFFCFC